jgi:methylated-DNA-[protein]-cysteine S-methyltransferase
MITIDTPVGPFSMTGDGNTVTAAAFGVDLPAGAVPESAAAAVRSYFDGDLTALLTVPVAQHGTPFLEHAWEVLRTIRRPVTYTEFASLLGRPAAVRAAAHACARNEIGLFTPCHRVLRTDGTLGGYRWGVDVKRWLLKHESGHA